MSQSAAVPLYGHSRFKAPALPLDVTKRDGTRAPFDLARIESAIARAGAALSLIHI